MSDEAVYIKLLKTGNNIGTFKVTADNYTTPTVSLISPNDTIPGYCVSKTSFVVGSTQLDDTTNPDNDARMLFDKVKGAFRAGTATGTRWDSVNRGTNSTALGNNNTASGESSIAVGNGNIASGENAFVAGAGSTATGVTSFSFGDNSDAVGTRSVSIGYMTTSSASDAISIGNECWSDSANSITLGQHCIASTAANATAIGQYCNATGMNSFAIGYGTGGIAPNANIAAGTGSVAIGNINNVTGTNSVAIGRSNTIVAGANNSYAIGQGCSINSSNATESIVMGTNAIMGSNNNSRCFFWNGDNTARTMPAVPTGSACFSCGSDINSVFAITFAGNIFTATSSATGYAWSSSSSIDLKENLVEHNYSDTLDKIMDMPIYTYNFKTAAPGIKSIGPVAQDFNRLFPSDKDQLSIVERDMCGVALAGVKGVKLRLDSLSTVQQSQINTLIESLTAANTQITTLSASLTAAIVRITALEGEAIALKSKVIKLEKD